MSKFDALDPFASEYEYVVPFTAGEPVNVTFPVNVTVLLLNW